MSVYEKRSTLRTKAGNGTKEAFQKGYIQQYRDAVTLQLLPSGVYLVEMLTVYGPETHMTRRLQTAREKFREFCEILDRSFPDSLMATQRVTLQ